MAVDIKDIIMGVYIPPYKSEQEAIDALTGLCLPMGLSADKCEELGKGVYAMCLDLRDWLVFDET